MSFDVVLIVPSMTMVVVVLYFMLVSWLTLPSFFSHFHLDWWWDSRWKMSYSQFSYLILSCAPSSSSSSLAYGKKNFFLFITFNEIYSFNDMLAHLCLATVNQKTEKMFFCFCYSFLGLEVCLGWNMNKQRTTQEKKSERAKSLFFSLWKNRSLALMKKTYGRLSSIQFIGV